MTIKKGEEWGTTGRLPDDAPLVADNAELFRLLNAEVKLPPLLGVTGGDLARTTGAKGGRVDIRTGVDRPILPIDIGMVSLDGTDFLFGAHVLIRDRLWRGPVTAVLNVPFIGQWNVAPRSHPNDGRLDHVEAALGWGDKLKARSLLPSGTHVPHPDISIRRVTSVEIDVPSGHRVWIDGLPQGGVRHVSCVVRPDAVSIVI